MEQGAVKILPNEVVPLGVLLSEEVPRGEVSMAIPTSAYWTGEPDEGNRDPDA
ncbi:MAG TPA: hypothetical protein VJI73_03580 [Candidatus Paceibacterota bacterium]